ncbi:MAG: hypothetical protein QGF00_08050 [Planctomycetota bacterium]|jgi:hypothetical protein|nr:hypothetical protein [Planctomycetota bacterium]MDP7249538.1 hypothetical protein [Planctomycetota bacterium]
MSALQPKTHNPDELLHGFTRTSTTSFIILAIVIHAVIVTGTSYPYIRDSYIDPEGAAKRKEEALKAEKAKLKADRDAAVGRAEEAAAKEKAEAAKGEKGKDESETGTDKGADDKTKTSNGNSDQPQVIKDITEKAKPEEIPRNPDDIGISIDDTN